jgi:hypothetical protein
VRLLQLATGPDELLDLHPNLTVVVGLDAGTHTTLVEAVSGLVAAAAPTDGLLEAHGVLFDIDAALLRVLQIDGRDLDPVVRPGDLPSGPVSVDAQELRALEQGFAVLLERISAQAERQSAARGALAAAEQAVDAAHRARREAEAGASGQLEEVDRLTRRLDELTGERRRIEEELAHVRAAEAEAAAAWMALEERTSGVRSARDVAVARRRALEDDLAAVEAQLDHAAVASLDEARAAVQAADDRRAAEGDRALAATPRHPEAAAAVDDEPAEDRVARLEARARELDDLLAVLEPVDADAVAQALAVLEGDDVTDLVPSTEAALLADELDAIASELNAMPEVDESTTGSSLAEARGRLDDDRQALLEAEQAVRNPQLDRDEVDRLEEVHAALLDATDRADRRLAGDRARRRVEELRAAEQEVLDRLGFASYPEYMMGTSLLHVDPVKEAALERAREELAAAEDEWREINTVTEVALARAALLDRRRTLLEQARELLGHAVTGGPPQEALRALLVPAVSRRDAAQRVQDALVAAGVELGDEALEDDELALLAEAWLDEVEQVGRRRRDVIAERERVEEELVAADGRRDGSGPALHLVVDPAETADETADAQQALLDAEARHAAHLSAVDRHAAVEAELTAAVALEQAAVDAATAADHEVAAAQGAAADLEQRRRELELALSSLEDEAVDTDAALRRVGGASPDVDELNRLIDVATARREEAIRTVQVEDQALAALDAEGRAAAVEIERLQDIVAAQGNGEATPADELEWYLLARLAAQRSASVAGSLPLLLDDALRGLDPAGIAHVLDRLEPMTEAVQIIIVSDDPVVAAWAAEAGPARAAVVRPTAA